MIKRKCNHTEIRSKYQKKKFEEFTSDESGKIAWELWKFMEENIFEEGDYNKSFPLGDTGVIMIRSKDCLAIELWKVVPCKANRYWLKVVPSQVKDKEIFRDIIEAQYWVYL